MFTLSFREVLPQILAVSVKNVVLIGFGMSLGFPTILIPALQQKPGEEHKNDDLSLNQVQISWISSINLICVPLGCIFSGSFATLIGRRRAMQLVNVPMFISWIIFYYSQHVDHLYVALCISGFTGGMLEAPVLTYVAEIAEPKIRGMLSATGSTCIILGIFSQFLMAIFLKWRAITIVSSSIPIIAIILLCFVPESPHWLILKKREEEAKKSLMWLRGWQKSMDNVKSEYEALYKNLTSSSSGSGKENILQEFKKRTFIFPYFICSLSFFIGHFSGMTTLQTYSVIIFSNLNAPIDKYLATTLLGTLEFIGTVMCVIFVKILGKRRLSFFSMTGCGICFLLTAIYAFAIRYVENLKMNSTTISGVENTTIFNNSTMSIDDPLDIENKYSWIPLTLLLSSAFLSHCGIRLLPWILIGEVYPGKIRGVSSGLSGGTGYVFGFLANKLFLSMVSLLTLPGTFLLNACVSFIGCAILFFILPETENRTLLEIEDHFAGVKKLPTKLSKCSSPPLEELPKDFDVKNWKSNEKFEKYLQEHKVKKSPIKNGKSTLNNENYDTHL